MKKITQSEFETTPMARPVLPVEMQEAIDAMQVGEGIQIERVEWPMKSHPAGHHRLIDPRQINKLSSFRALRLPDCVTKVGNNAFSLGSSDEALGFAQSLLRQTHSLRCETQGHWSDARDSGR